MTGAYGEVPAWMRRLVPGLIVLLMGTLLLLPPGENLGSDHEGYWDAEKQEYVVEKKDRVLGTTTGRIVGQFTFQFLVVSLFFAWRRPLGDRVGQRLRTRFHRGLGVIILVLAAAHAAILLPNLVFRGWLTGMLSFGVLACHGVLGTWKPRFIGRWGAARWRYMHMTTAWTGLLLGLHHAFFYGQHYGLFREAVFGGGY